MAEDPVERDAWMAIGALFVPQQVVFCSYDKAHLDRVQQRVDEIMEAAREES